MDVIGLLASISIFLCTFTRVCPSHLIEYFTANGCRSSFFTLYICFSSHCMSRQNAGDHSRCKGFMLQCSLYFSSQEGVSERATIHQFIKVLTNRAHLILGTPPPAIPTGDQQLSSGQGDWRKTPYSQAGQLQCCKAHAELLLVNHWYWLEQHGHQSNLSSRVKHLSGVPERVHLPLHLASIRRLLFHGQALKNSFRVNNGGPPYSHAGKLECSCSTVCSKTSTISACG